MKNVATLLERDRDYKFCCTYCGCVDVVEDITSKKMVTSISCDHYTDNSADDYIQYELEEYPFSHVDESEDPPKFTCMGCGKIWNSIDSIVKDNCIIGVYTAAEAMANVDTFKKALGAYYIGKMKEEDINKLLEYGRSLLGSKIDPDSDFTDISLIDCQIWRDTLDSCTRK